MAKELGFSAGLLLAGEAPLPAQLAAFVPRSLYWVAADGGCQHAAKYPIALQAVVGDFDSADPPRNLPSLRFLRDKDESDRNLALEYLIRQGHRYIAQVGGGGARSDHFLAMIYDYQLKRSAILPKLWLTAYEAIFYLEAGEQLELGWSQKAPLLSAFPLCAKSRLYSEQLQWPLAVLQQGAGLQLAGNTGAMPYSLSNRATGPTAMLGVQQGAALVFWPYPAQIQGIFYRITTP